MIIPNLVKIILFKVQNSFFNINVCIKKYVKGFALGISPFLKNKVKCDFLYTFDHFVLISFNFLGILYDTFTPAT